MLQIGAANTCGASAGEGTRLNRAGHTEGGNSTNLKEKKKEEENSVGYTSYFFFFFLSFLPFLIFFFFYSFFFSRSSKTAGLCTLELARRENKGEKSEKERGENYTRSCAQGLQVTLEGRERSKAAGQVICSVFTSSRSPGLWRRGGGWLRAIDTEFWKLRGHLNAPS